MIINTNTSLMFPHSVLWTQGHKYPKLDLPSSAVSILAPE